MKPPSVSTVPAPTHGVRLRRQLMSNWNFPNRISAGAATPISTQIAAPHRWMRLSAIGTGRVSSQMKDAPPFSTIPRSAAGQSAISPCCFALTERSRHLIRLPSRCCARHRSSGYRAGHAPQPARTLALDARWKIPRSTVARSSRATCSAQGLSAFTRALMATA